MRRAAAQNKEAQNKEGFPFGRDTRGGEATHVDTRERLVAREPVPDGAGAAVRQAIPPERQACERHAALERLANVSSAARADGVPAQVELEQPTGLGCGGLPGRERGEDGADAVVADAIVRQCESQQRRGRSRLQERLRECPRAVIAHPAAAEIERMQRGAFGEAWCEHRGTNAAERGASQRQRFDRLAALAEGE